MPLVLVLNPQNWLIVPSSVWRNGHDPPPQAALPVPVLELSHLIGWPARVVHAPHAGEKSAQTSWAIPSPRLFRGSVVRTKKHVFAVATGATPAQPAVLMAVTTAGQPPVGATSSQFAFVVTPLMPASAKAWIKCCAAAQKSGVPIRGCHGWSAEPMRVPVGQVAKVQL